jgi:hypothetical protein
MSGNQSRGLIAASKTRGWDPTVIPARDGEAANSSILPRFDRDQGNLANGHVGQLPDGTPDGWPDGHDVLGVPSPAVQSLDWQESQNSGNEPKRGTRGANPYPGFGGEGY